MKSNSTLPLTHIVVALSCIGILMITGCETTKTEDTKSPDVSVDESAEPTAPTQASEQSAEPEPQMASSEKKKKSKKKKRASETVYVETENGPGNAPPPKGQTQDQLHKMEKNLAPLEAVPAVSQE